MTRNINEIKQLLNLNSHSSTKGWFGFFEASSHYTPELADIAINHFFDFIDNNISGSILFLNFSLYESIEQAVEVYRLGKSEQILLDWLYQSNWLKINNNQESQPDLEAILASQLSQQEIINLVSATIRVGDFIGHCFIYVPNLELVFYAHEDIGFGVICTREKGRQYADLYLRDIAKNKDFSAYKGKRCLENIYD
ncbi:MAG: hypothetical protein AB4062_03995 [Crocosphaera sp.]